MASTYADRFFADIETIPDLLRKRAAETPTAIAHYTQDREGAWSATTWADLAAAVDRVASRLRSLGLAPGSRIAILAATSQDWEICQVAALQVGAAVIGIDPYYPAEQVNRILTELAPDALFVGDATLLAQVGHAIRERCRFIAMFASPPEDAQEVLSFASLKSGGAPPPEAEPGATATTEPKATADTERVRGDDPAIVVFSSGTTGTPKPILYSHAQVCLACRAILDAFQDIEPGCRLVCWLPMANLFQRIINFCAMANGAVTYVVNDPRWVLESLPAANPHLFVAVPRFFERLYRGIEERLAALPKPLAAIIRSTLAASVQDHRLRRLGQPVPLATRMLALIARKTVVRRLRAVMGTNLKYIVSGSAPCPAWILDTFAGLDLPILEAYGQSENIIPIAMNVVGAHKPGTVGRPVKYNEVRLSPEGVVEVRGPGVFLPQLGENRLRPAPAADGFLVTGDLGEIDRDGFLRLTGRQAEVFKAANGRWISPADIEAVLRQVAYVEQAAVAVQSGGIVIGIVSLSLTSCPHVRASARPGTRTSPADEAVRNAIQADFEQQLADVARPLWPHGLILTSQLFSIEGGELTTNFKLRRAAVVQKYAAAIEALASEIGTASSARPEEQPIRIHAL